MGHEGGLSLKIEVPLYCHTTTYTSPPTHLHHTSPSHISITHLHHTSPSHISITHLHHTSPSHISITHLHPHLHCSFDPLLSHSVMTPAGDQLSELKVRLLRLEQQVYRKFLKPPLGDDDPYVLVMCSSYSLHCVVYMYMWVSANEAVTSQ